MFKLIRSKLKIETWEDSGFPEVKMYDRARQIAKIVYEKEKINLYNLQKDINYPHYEEFSL